MEDFKWNKKDSYTDEDLKQILADHRNKVYAEAKTDVTKEYEPKIKEVEAKYNTLEENQLFSTIKNDKHKDAIKSLMSTDKYKDLSKTEAFKKVTEDYKDIFNIQNENKEEKEKSKTDGINDIGKTLLALHEGTDNPQKLDELERKAKTKGLNDPKELETYISAVKAEALKNTKK